eukprot:1995285-Prymnesium_polylepis.1
MHYGSSAVRLRVKWSGVWRLASSEPGPVARDVIRLYCHVYVGARFGTYFACPPGMTGSSGADCSAPGISPCPLR